MATSTESRRNEEKRRKRNQLWTDHQAQCARADALDVIPDAVDASISGVYTFLSKERPKSSKNAYLALRSLAEERLFSALRKVAEDAKRDSATARATAAKLKAAYDKR